MTPEPTVEPDLTPARRLQHGIMQALADWHQGSVAPRTVESDASEDGHAVTR